MTIYVTHLNEVFKINTPKNSNDILTDLKQFEKKI